MFRSAFHNLLGLNAKIFTPYLRSEKIQFYVTDNFIELPAAAIAFGKMIANRFQLRRISLVEAFLKIAEYEIFSYVFVDVFFSLFVIAFSSKSVDWDIKEENVWAIFCGCHVQTRSSRALEYRR